MDEHCKLLSSHGEVTSHANTGLVTAIIEWPDGDEVGCLSDIVRVDAERIAKSSVALLQLTC
jgi:hypothetical protein